MSNRFDRFALEDRPKIPDGYTAPMEFKTAEQATRERISDRDAIERDRINERRMREEYERALEQIANCRNGVKPLEDFEAQEIAQNALRRVKSNEQ